MTKFNLLFIPACLIILTNLSFAENLQKIQDLDLSNVKSENANEAVHICGRKLIENIQSISTCKGNEGAQCWSNGPYTSDNFNSMRSLGDLKKQYLISLGLQNEYRLQHNYERREFDIFKRMSVKSCSNEHPCPLQMQFSINNDSPITIETVEAFPVLSFDEEEQKNCHFDSWGRQICEESKFVLTNFHWILSENFKGTTQWINSETKILINKYSDFQNYMKCVESYLNFKK
jgi:hypothetical protein